MAPNVHYLLMVLERRELVRIHCMISCALNICYQKTCPKLSRPIYTNMDSRFFDKQDTVPRLSRSANKTDGHVERGTGGESEWGREWIDISNESGGGVVKEGSLRFPNVWHTQQLSI